MWFEKPKTIREKKKTNRRLRQSLICKHVKKKVSAKQKKSTYVKNMFVCVWMRLFFFFSLLDNLTTVNVDPKQRGKRSQK